MLDLRIEHLRFREIESRCQAADFDRSRAAGLAAELRDLLGASEALDRRFCRLNEGYLKPQEIEYINTMRTMKMKALHDRLTSIAR